MKIKRHNGKRVSSLKVSSCFLGVTVVAVMSLCVLQLIPPFFSIPDSQTLVASFFDDDDNDNDGANNRRKESESNNQLLKGITKRPHGNDNDETPLHDNMHRHEANHKRTSRLAANRVAPPSDAKMQNSIITGRVQNILTEKRKADSAAARAYSPQAGNIPAGILSNKDASFFDAIRHEIDKLGVYHRCRPYQFLNNETSEKEAKSVHRRIFFGSLIADEPWELLEIVAAETRNIFESMVFVESNRTQHFVPRPLQRVGQEERLQTLFGTRKLEVRVFVNEDPLILDLAREHEQRQLILEGWREMGMNENDVGYISDMDETFTRDFLRAIQTCPDIDFLNYDKHHCHPSMARLNGAGRVFEAFPDCLTQRRSWHHPDMIIGACIELIGDPTKNPIAEREAQFLRTEGVGSSCDEEGLRNVQGNSYPLYNAADFRRMCGGHMPRRTAEGNKAEYTAYHFHNFFANFNQTRFKYKTYGHPHYGAFTKKLVDIHEDLELINRCLKNVSNADNSTSTVDHGRIHLREEGGLALAKQPWPIYFHDEDYRERKATSIREEFEADEASRQAYVKGRQDAELTRRAALLKNSKILST